MRVQSISNYANAKNRSNSVESNPSNYMAKTNSKNSFDNVSFGMEIPKYNWLCPEISPKNKELFVEINTIITKKINELPLKKQIEHLKISNNDSYIPDVVLAAETTDGSAIKLYRQERGGFPHCYMKVANTGKQRGTSVVLHTTDTMAVEKYPIDKNGDPTIWPSAGRKEYQNTKAVDTINTEVQSYLEALITQNTAVEKKSNIFTKLFTRLSPSKKTN